MTPDIEALCARLDDAERATSYCSIEHGCCRCGLEASTASEAAAALREQARKLEERDKVWGRWGPALAVVEAERDALQARVKEHEMFRHQHRDCDAMGVELQRLRAENEGLRKDVERWSIEFSNPPRLPCAHCGKTIAGTYYCLTSENRVWCSDFCRNMRDVEKEDKRA